MRTLQIFYKFLHDMCPAITLDFYKVCTWKTYIKLIYSQEYFSSIWYSDCHLSLLRALAKCKYMNKNLHYVQGKVIK